MSAADLPVTLAVVRRVRALWATTDVAEWTGMAALYHRYVDSVDAAGYPEEIRGAGVLLTIGGEQREGDASTSGRMGSGAGEVDQSVSILRFLTRR